MRKLLAIGASILIMFVACRSNQHHNDSTDPYEKGKASVEEIEKKNPARFLSVSGKNKKNLVGQTVIRGNIHSNAKMVAFKDIDLKLSFYSKTGALLEEDREVIYETVNPGDDVQFKSKYFAPKGTDSVALKVIGAKY